MYYLQSLPLHQLPAAVVFKSLTASKKCVRMRFQFRNVKSSNSNRMVRKVCAWRSVHETWVDVCIYAFVKTSMW